MKDMLSIIYDKIENNPIIKANVITDKNKLQITYFETSETIDSSIPFITIIPMEPPQPSDFASDKELSLQFSYQINVEGKKRLIVKQIQSEIKKELWALKFGQLDGGLDEYFKETGRFVDARRYRTITKLHDTDY